MQITPGQEQAYFDWKALNTDHPYSVAVFTFAERWAERMEIGIAGGAEVADVARAAATEADKADEGGGLTGYQYGCAVQILAKHWVHGEALRRWHNLDIQIGDEGVRANEKGSVLNPALLHVGLPPT